MFASSDKGYTQIAYAGYKSNIAVFLHATVVHKRTVITDSGYPLPLPADQLVPFLLPHVSFYHTSESRATIEAFKEPYATRMREVPHGKKSMLVLTDYTLNDLAEISSSVSTSVRGPIGTTSLEGLRGYLTALKIMTVFLATHTYPGYKTNANKEVLEYLEESSPVEISVSAVLESDSEEDDEMDLSASIGLEGKKQKVELEGRVNGRDGVLTAKPSPLPPSVNIGYGSEIPADLPGVTFPYFDGMIDADGPTLSRIVHQYFYRNFGETKAQCHSAFVAWRKTVSDWIRTEAGRAISHVFFGIHLALESQTRLYVVCEDDRYLGFVLLGGHFHVSSQSVSVSPVEGEELRTEIRAMSQHARALDEIKELLSGQALLEGGEVEKVEDDAMSARSLMRELWRRKEFSGEDLQTLKKNIAKVHFVKPAYLAPTIENLKRLIAVIADPASKEFEDEAMYINPGRLYQRDPKYIALAAFGPTAPSFVNAQGLAYQIPGPTEHDAANVEVEVSGRKAKTMNLLIMTMKPIEIAFEDWKLTIRDGTIRVNQAERAAPARTYVYKGDNRDILWDCFKEEIGRRRAEKGAADASKKRGRNDDDEEGPRKKSTRSTGELFNVFSF